MTQDIQKRAFTVADIPTLMKFDIDIFPPFMRTSYASYEWLLSRSNVVGVEYYSDDVLVGIAFAVPAKELQAALNERDALLVCSASEMYSCSEGVLKEYQNKGIGAQLIVALAQAVRSEGYTHLSAHVRAVHGWARKRAQVLKLIEQRVVPNFWKDQNEVVEYQRADLSGT